EAAGKGVMVVMDQRILSARDTEKKYARSGGVQAGGKGMLGGVTPQGVGFFYPPTRRNTATAGFDVQANTALPRVEIRYSYAGAEATGKTDAKGIVVVTTGFTPAERTYYEGLQHKGVVVATTFPSGEQVGSPVSARDNAPTVTVERMLPTHARIL